MGKSFQNARETFSTNTLGTINLLESLLNLDNFTENQMLETLNPVINSDSVWKAHGLLLMAEFYLDKKELIKSKEFFTKVSEIENLNQSIKQDVQKKLSREFSE